MRRIVPLKTLTHTSGGRGLIELDQLPRGHYLKGFLFNLPHTITGAAAAQPAILPRAFNRVLDSVKIGRRIATTGQGINVLNWMMGGKDNSSAAYIPADAGVVVFDRVTNLFLPFADFSAYEADDTAPAVELLKDTPIEIVFGAWGTLFSGATVTAGANLQTLAVIEAGAPGKIATPVQIDTVDLTPDSRLDPGIYTHVALMKEDGTGITSAEVTSLTLIIDGTPVLDGITVGQLAAAFNAMKAVSGEPSAYATATPFTTIPAEGVVEQPGSAAGAGAGITADFLPLLFPQLAGKLTKAWACPTGIRIKWSGTATGLRAVTRRVEPVSDAQVVKAAAKIGLPAPTTITAKTASKSPVPAKSWVESVVPKKIG